MRLNNKIYLKAITAIHSTKLGPAIGGCRFIEYDSGSHAIQDAVRLAKAMTYKAAMAHLPLGGGKLVLLKPKENIDRKKYFEAVGEFVQSLHGEYITAVDSGTGTQDMDIIATKTSHVTSTTSCGDPSIMTAEGVEMGIRAALLCKFGNSSLKGIHVGIQGLGHAGYNLAKRLHQAGAKLTVFDINTEAVARCVLELGAHKVDSLNEFLALDCEVLSPCALGGVLNDQSIPLIKAGIVAGCANNQLQDPQHGQVLLQKNILYAPDYVINAGGLIYVAAQYNYIEKSMASQRINDLHDTLVEIFKRSIQEAKPTSDIADTIAQEKLGL